jgi:ankyrin repeat protein
VLTCVAALAMAGHFGHAETIEVLVAAGADVNSRSDKPKGCTPLMWAASANEAEAVKTLIAHGADLHAVAADGNTVLDVALRYRSPEVVDVLLEAIGGERYPKESVAVQLAMTKERAAAKALMTTASVMHSHMETQVGELDKYAWVGWVLEQGGDLVKPLAMTKMLYAAVIERDAGLVQALVDHGCDVNRKLESVITPLSIAVTQRYLDIVQVLLEAGADPNQAMRGSETRGGSTMTPFDYAIVHMREMVGEQLINSLLNSGRCRINQGADLNWTAFSWVLKQTKDPEARESAVDLAERMVLSIQNVDDDRDDNGFTLLHIATHHQSLWMVDLLLDRGADIEATADDGTTPFLLACQQDPEFGMQLLQRGANFNAKTRKTNASVLHVMAVAGLAPSPHLVEMGLDINEQTLRGYTPLASALSYGHEALTLTLMARGAHVNWKTDKDRTALHFAARHGMHAAVEKILEHDVDINAVDSSGWTSLHEACATGNTAVVALLLDAGADIERPIPTGDRPLHCALINGKEDIVLLLLERGADFTAIASMKRTPLHVAADYDLPRAADALLMLTNGSTIEAVDEQDWTPLCCTRSLAIVEILIKAGADVNHVDNNGWTPLHQAVQEGNTEVALELVRAGASLEARTKNDGLTVTERAIDLWSWSDSDRIIRPQLLEMAEARREERQRAEENEPVGGPFEVIRTSD